MRTRGTRFTSRSGVAAEAGPVGRYRHSDAEPSIGRRLSMTSRVKATTRVSTMATSCRKQGKTRMGLTYLDHGPGSLKAAGPPERLLPSRRITWDSLHQALGESKKLQKLTSAETTFRGGVSTEFLLFRRSCSSEQQQKPPFGEGSAANFC
jgi:hypothetical protein